VAKRRDLEFGSTVQMSPLDVVFAREGLAPTDQIAPLPQPIPKASSQIAVTTKQLVHPRGPRRQRETLKALPKSEARKPR
jgi:hypothetical protein